MNMDKMSSRPFSAHTGEMSKVISNIGYKCLEKARARVREVETENNYDINDESIIDVSVSYDGTWHKRGHTSNYGIGVVIELQTGLVIDYAVLSKFCRKCVVTATELDVQSPEFEI